MAKERARRLTPAEFDQWMVPKDASDTLDYMTGWDARSAIVARLQNGLLLAVARTVIFRNKRADFFPVETSDWESVSSQFPHSPFWLSGDLQTTIRDDYGNSEDISFFGVRFDPAGMQAILDGAPGRRSLASTASQIGPSQTDPEETGPPVSATDLRVWLEAYTEVYGGKPEDTVPFAWESAKGMFPNKSVSRQKVRDLLAGRKPGPKAAKP